MERTRSAPELGFHTYGPTSVDTSAHIVVTRFRVRTFWGLLATWIDYKRLERSIAGSSGLLKQVFLFEDFHSACSISVWDSALSIDRFGAEHPFHVAVANALFPRIKRRPDGLPELWSLRAKPISVSSDLKWGDLDIRSYCRPLHEHETEGDDVLHQ